MSTDFAYDRVNQISANIVNKIHDDRMSQTTDRPTTPPCRAGRTRRASAPAPSSWERTTSTSTSGRTFRRAGSTTSRSRSASSDLGLAGFALKSHYTSTAERAQVVSGVVPGVRVLGALTLNQAVGGMNALAVEIAAREGARIVWMPTVDSPAETAGRSDPKPGDKVPQWARLQHELRGLGLGVEPVHVTDDEGRVLPETRDVLRAIARHGLVLATAHLARDDTFAVVEAAFDEGVEHVVVTHPEFTCQRFTIEDQVALAERGCLIERCLSTPHSGKTTFEHVFDGVRAVGLERNFFSSDFGNPDYPPVEDGLALWADRLLGRGLRRGRDARDDRRGVEARRRRMTAVTSVPCRPVDPSAVREPVGR